MALVGLLVVSAVLALMLSAGVLRRASRSVPLAVVVTVALFAPAAAAQESPEAEVPVAGGDAVSPPAEDPAPATPVEHSVARSAPLMVGEPEAARAVAVPAASSSVVTVSRSGDEARAGQSPISVAMSDEAIDAGRKDSAVVVEVLSERARNAIGAEGIGFRLSRDSASTLGLPVDVSIDYSSLRGLYGAGWEDRLQVVQFEGCGQGVEGDCRAVPLESVNDRDTGTIRASIEIPTSVSAGAGGPRAGGGGGTYGLMAGSAGPNGTYKATDLSPYGEWTVGLNSGAFSWSYPLPDATQISGVGPVGGFSLGYSSAAVDGMTGAANAQSGYVGLGWSLGGGGSIERRYRSCGQDGTTGNAAGDLCYFSDNATITLNGVTSELVPTGTANVFRLEADQRWRVERATGSANGVNGGEYWVVTTAEGWRYHFGLGAIPNTSPLQYTSSAWGVRVRGNNAGEPCYGMANGCDMGWRWNLDRIEDPFGNITTLLYTPETNSYGFNNGTAPVAYTRGGYLSEVRTAQRAGFESNYWSRWLFTTDGRCLALSSCPAATPANSAQYPDTPVDLVCSASPCNEHSPTFFTTRRLTNVATQVWTGSAFDTVDEVALVHSFTNNSYGERYLWLDYVQRTGRQGTGSPMTLTWTQFNFSAASTLANRRDSNPGAGVTPKEMPRIDAITNEFGGRTEVTYGQPHPCPTIPVGTWDTNATDCFPAYLDLGSGAGWGAFNKYLVTQVREVDAAYSGYSPGATVATSYQYLDTPAWHHDDDLVSPAGVQSWTDWRGHGTVRVIRNPGGTGPNYTVSDHRYMRGMHGDRYSNGTLKSVPVQTLDGSASRFDENWFAGFQIDEQQYDYGGNVHLGQVTWPTHQDIALTANQASRLVVTDYTESRTRIGSTFRRSRTDYAYDSYGNQTLVGEWGDNAVAGDERCTQTTYVANVGAFLLNLPYQSIRWDNYSNNPAPARICTGAALAETQTGLPRLRLTVVVTDHAA